MEATVVLDAIARKQVEHWIVPVSSVALEASDDRLLEFLKTINHYSNKLLTKAIDMRGSVANENGEIGRNHLLPTGLVKLAEKIFQFIFYSAYSLRVWQKNGIFPKPFKDEPFLSPGHSPTGCEYLAKLAGSAMAQAREELMLMAHTGESQSPVLHMRATPESSLLPPFTFSEEEACWRIFIF